jgi:hypothetical protein
MAWDDALRQHGKEVLARLRLANENEELQLDSVELKHALRELDQQYGEPPINRRRDLCAQLCCTGGSWIGSFGDGYSRDPFEVTSECNSAEEALMALVERFDQWLQKAIDEAREHRAVGPEAKGDTMSRIAELTLEIERLEKQSRAIALGPAAMGRESFEAFKAAAEACDDLTDEICALRRELEDLEEDAALRDRGRKS